MIAAAKHITFDSRRVGMNARSVVPENIHTFPKEGFCLRLNPPTPPPLEFPV